MDTTEGLIIGGLLLLVLSLGQISQELCQQE
jgi:hypothetical protein